MRVGGKNGNVYGIGDEWVVEEVESGLFGIELDSGGITAAGAALLVVVVDVGIRIVHRMTSRTSGGGGTDGGLSFALVVMVVVVVLTVSD